MNYQELKDIIDLELLLKYPKKILKKYRLVPIYKEEDIVHFISDSRVPLFVIDELELLGSNAIKIEFIDSTELDLMINDYLEAPIETVEGMIEDLDTVSEDFTNLELDSKVENLEELAQEAPVIRLVNAIVTTALKKQASDIHLEPFEKKVKLRYRIDGILYNTPAPPRKLYAAIVTRIKIMAGLNIAERRLPQEGRIRIKVLGRELDIRVSTITTLYGETVVMRLLDRAEFLLDIENIGFSHQVLKEYKEVIELSHGIILVTGPTGSGKTTTLYATLEKLNSVEKKIITIEVPVEYQLEGINQIQVKPEIDFTFARGLRSILRQDPDIIMIGEIRDYETASIAIQAALTGHLVFATLHTNDASSAIIRLLDMGVEDYLLSATLKGVLAQRLVRILCQECYQEYYIDNLNLKLKGIAEGEYKLYRAIGCEKCNHIGYHGRTGIYEFIEIDDNLAELINNGSSLYQIRAAAKNKGVKTLLEDGWSRVEKGISSLDEIIRVTRV